MTIRRARSLSPVSRCQPDIRSSFQRVYPQTPSNRQILPSFSIELLHPPEAMVVSGLATLTRFGASKKRLGEKTYASLSHVLVRVLPPIFWGSTRSPRAPKSRTFIFPSSTDVRTAPRNNLRPRAGFVSIRRTFDTLELTFHSRKEDDLDF